jgi:hypothetical protein
MTAVGRRWMTSTLLDTMVLLKYEKHLDTILLCVNEASVHKNKTTDLKAKPTRYYKDQQKPTNR